MNLSNKIKEFVCEYTFSDTNKDRFYTKDVVINGRTYTKYGTATATTVVCLQYKITDPSTNRSEYLTLMGVARQNPGDNAVNEQLGYEIATENALMSPVATFVTPTEMSRCSAKAFVYNYIKALPVQFIKTRQELQNEGKDLSNYNRNTRKETDNYFNKYYNDCKKIFKRYQWKR